MSWFDDFVDSVVPGKGVGEKVAQVLSDQKDGLRARLQDDPGIYIDLDHEVSWLLIRKFPESEIKIEKLDVISADLIVDEEKTSEEIEVVEVDRRVFENDTDIDQTRDYTFQDQYSDQTFSQFSKTITSINSSVSTVDLRLNKSIGAVVGNALNAGASFQQTNSITTQVLTGGSTTGTKVETITINESLTIPPRSFLIVTVTLVQSKTFTELSGSVEFDGVVNVKKSYDGLKLGRQAMKYVLKDELSRRVTLTGSIKTTIVKDTSVRWADSKIPPAFPAYQSLLLAMPADVVLANTVKFEKK